MQHSLDSNDLLSDLLLQVRAVNERIEDEHRFHFDGTSHRQAKIKKFHFKIKNQTPQIIFMQNVKQFF